MAVVVVVVIMGELCYYMDSRNEEAATQKIPKKKKGSTCLCFVSALMAWGSILCNEKSKYTDNNDPVRLLLAYLNRDQGHHPTDQGKYHTKHQVFLRFVNALE